MTEPDRRGIRWTIFGVLVFMAIVVASFVHRVGEPRVMSLLRVVSTDYFYLIPLVMWAVFR